MAVTKITNLEFGKMVQAAADKLGKNAEFINSLNVFPVPDGDTGTNMTSSMASGAKYERNETSKRVGDLSAALAKGLLMGARGNSGVILSQIFRGFAKATEGMDVLSTADFVNAYANGAKTAYKAVMKPTEGTILTVVREPSHQFQHCQVYSHHFYLRGHSRLHQRLEVQRRVLAHQNLPRQLLSGLAINPASF